MFKLDPKPRFTATVKVDVPVDGGFDAQTFKATFEVLGTKAAAKYDFESPESSTEFLQRVFVDFSDVAGVDDAALSFNDATRDALVDMPFTRRALIRSYFDNVNKASLGN